MKILVAVYGTLRRGLWNHHWMEGAQLLGSDRLREITLYDLGPYPGAVKQPSGGVEVEVYAVSPEKLRQLDILEGHIESEPESGLYDREIMATCHGPAWVYLYNHDVAECPAIREGPWMPRQQGVPEW